MSQQPARRAQDGRNSLRGRWLLPVLRPSGPLRFRREVFLVTGGNPLASGLAALVLSARHGID